MYNNYARRQVPLGRRIRGCVTGLVLLALIVAGLLFVLFRIHGGVTVSVGDHPSIVGRECNGDIIVHVGPVHQVTLSGLFPQYQQDATGNIVELTQCDGQTTLTVPPHTDLQFEEADSVTVFGVTGTMNLDVNGGRTTLIGCTLEGQSKLSDNGGVITFVGGLAQGSTSTMDDNGGTINATLPASASFHLAISGILGPITSNYSQVQTANTAAGDNIQANIGSAASATNLKLDLNDTAVILRQGS